MKFKSVLNPRTIFLSFLLALTPQAGLAKSSATTVLVLGDSISAAFGMAEESGWVELFKQRLQQQGNYQVINASISGETTSGGLRRLPKLLQDYQPDLLIVELGANDGLRGQPIKLIEANLTSIVQMGKQHGSEVYLLGMLIPPNYGSKYLAQFHAVFKTVAKQEKIALMPFFLHNVATNDALMQADGLHPNAKAQPQLLKNLLQHLPSTALATATGEKH